MADLKTTLALDDKRFRRGLDTAAQDSDRAGARIARSLSGGLNIARAIVGWQVLHGAIRNAAEAMEYYGQRNEFAKQRFEAMAKSWKTFWSTVWVDIVEMKPVQDVISAETGTGVGTFYDWLKGSMRRGEFGFQLMPLGEYLEREKTRRGLEEQATRRSAWEQTAKGIEEGLDERLRQLRLEGATDAEKRGLKLEELRKEYDEALEMLGAKYRAQEIDPDKYRELRAKIEEIFDLAQRNLDRLGKTARKDLGSMAIEGDALITAARRKQIFGTADFLRPKPDDRAYRQRDHMVQLLQKVQNAIERWNIGYAP